ncbi:MAG: EscU/YscU/HrcU family type III secretion system export apparatus switch protein [Candidatus Velthaea sp.]|jgi:flagellar biosynthesis protein
MNRRFYDTRRTKTERAAAAALTYDPLGNAPPEITASGSGLVAERIIALAREHHVPLHQDPGLVEALSRLEVGSLIPRELYTVVAEILAFVYAVDAEQQQESTNAAP